MKERMDLLVELEGQRVHAMKNGSGTMCEPFGLCYLAREMKDSGSRCMARLCARAILEDREDDVMAVLLQGMFCRKEERANGLSEDEEEVGGISETYFRSQDERPDP